MIFLSVTTLLSNQSNCCITSRVRFYTIQVLLAIEHLHNRNIIYRDLKPENILLDETGYLKLSEFTSATILDNPSDRRSSIIGTPEYIAPEILIDGEYGLDVDWWSFGILIYELLYGNSPFHDSDHEKMFENITENEPNFPNDTEVSDEVQDLVLKLLQKNPGKRLSDSSEILRHTWFKDIDVGQILSMSIKPPLIPPKLSDEDQLKSIQNEEEDPRHTIRASLDILQVENYDYEFRNLSYSRGLVKILEGLNFESINGARFKKKNNVNPQQ